MNSKAIAAAVSLAALSLSVQAGPVLDAVKARGQLI